MVVKSEMWGDGELSGNCQATDLDVSLWEKCGAKICGRAESAKMRGPRVAALALLACLAVAGFSGAKAILQGVLDVICAVARQTWLV